MFSILTTEGKKIIVSEKSSVVLTRKHPNLCGCFNFWQHEMMLAMACIPRGTINFDLLQC